MSSECIVIEDGFPGYPVNMFCIPKQYEDCVKSVLLPRGLILDRIEKLTKDIIDNYGEDGVVAVCVLKGGYGFYTDMLQAMKKIARHRSIRFPIQQDFIRCTRCRTDNSTNNSTGEERIILGDFNLDIVRGKNVLIMDDVVDSGNSLLKVREFFGQVETKSIKFATLALMRSPNNKGFKPDYTCFEIPYIFPVGYSIDVNEYFRDLQHLCLVDERKVHANAFLKQQSPSKAETVRPLN